MESTDPTTPTTASTIMSGFYFTPPSLSAWVLKPPLRPLFVLLEPVSERISKRIYEHIPGRFPNDF